MVGEVGNGHQPDLHLDSQALSVLRPDHAQIVGPVRAHCHLSCEQDLPFHSTILLCQGDDLIRGEVRPTPDSNSTLLAKLAQGDLRHRMILQLDSLRLEPGNILK